RTSAQRDDRNAMPMTTMPPAAVPRPVAVSEGEPEIPKRRNVEALLLLFALAIGLFAYANVDQAITGKYPSNLAALGLEFGIVLLVAHLAVRRFAPYADPVILPVAAMINGLGLLLS